MEKIGKKKYYNKNNNHNWFNSINTHNSRISQPEIIINVKKDFDNNTKHGYSFQYSSSWNILEAIPDYD